MRFPSKKYTYRRFIRLLSFLLLLQGLLPVQLHTVLVRDDNGRLLEVCTLEGVKTVVMDEHGDPVSDSTQGNERSAAIVFSQLVAEALPDTAEPLVIYSPPADFHHPLVQMQVISIAPPGLLPIRAPPIV
ncbi:MAG: hypothetical protein OQL16_13540 [Gammaproteobacteria bacterium]|nr:hypothetical protein [Gammaproteobacteria bacterium]